MGEEFEDIIGELGVAFEEINGSEDDEVDGSFFVMFWFVFLENLSVDVLEVPAGSDQVVVRVFYDNLYGDLVIRSAALQDLINIEITVKFLC